MEGRGNEGRVGLAPKVEHPQLKFLVAPLTKCDRAKGGSKLAKNSVTYFMNGPISPGLFSSNCTHVFRPF